MTKQLINYDEAYQRYFDYFAGYEDIPTKDWFIYEAEHNQKFADKWLPNKELKEVRFADSHSYEPQMIDMSRFKVSSEFSDEIFGWYDNILIAIKK